MSISAVNSVKQRTKSNLKQELVAKQEQQQGISKEKVCSITAAAALSAAVLGGIIGHKHCEETQKLVRRTMQNALDETQRKVTDLTENNKNLQKINKELKKQVANAKAKFDEIFEGCSAPKDVQEKIVEKLRAKMEAGNLDYDIATPPVTGKSKAPVYSNAVELPANVGTVNRAGMKDLQIPEIEPNRRFDFELPMSDEVKINHAKSLDFRPERHTTNISENYADSVQWNSDKIARDILQNFFDGHGQTLDGVKLSFIPTGSGKYKVRIDGKSTYTADKALYIGESTKRNNSRAAGNYGEGLKMAALKLLKDCGAQDVKLASDNWKLTYNLAEGNLTDKRVLAYSLDKVDKFNGNYIEFETTDMNLLQSLRKSINRFYHSNNPHFKCPDFENDLVGIKLLPKGEKGGVYIAGQRFEFEGGYDGLDEVVLFLKEKPPVNILDPSRDRVSLNSYNLGEIARWLAKSNMSKTDKVKLLASLEKYWDQVNIFHQTPMHNFVQKFASKCGDDIKIKFPEKYIAYSRASDDIVRDLENNGYKVCHEDFEKLGMPTIKNIIGDARAHDVVIPNDVQKKKIILLKEALKKLAPSLEGKHFNASELDTKIYMFDNSTPKERRLYSDCLAEAITDFGESKGFWIDKNYLDRASFNDVLETALHELSHKVGGDESSAFSYKLTNVNRDAIGQLISDTQTKYEFQTISQLWDTLK